MARLVIVIGIVLRLVELSSSMSSYHFLSSRANGVNLLCSHCNYIKFGWKLKFAMYNPAFLITIFVS